MKMRGGQTQHACIYCRRSNKKCDDVKPCQRCIQQGTQRYCYIADRREKGVVVPMLRGSRKDKLIMGQLLFDTELNEARKKEDKLMKDTKKIPQEIKLAFIIAEIEIMALEEEISIELKNQTGGVLIDIDYLAKVYTELKIKRLNVRLCILMKTIECIYSGPSDDEEKEELGEEDASLS
eukprot:GHVP01046731.1.p1 GENE.GHVP01046731.1~~GHVP01046731.1.p1  ORF type:complete len:179 (-),score=25.53 GHVP01046731.1:480-1016(-)